MLVFIVPLKSQKFSKNWDRVSLLCKQTIASISSQTIEEFHTILTCNEVPSSLREDKHLTLISENFPAPSNINEARKDKYWKIKRGMIEAGKLNASHVMLVDADDLVSRQLASYCKDNSFDDGYYFNSGYIFDERIGALYLRPNFSKVSGTSHIIKMASSDFPSSMDTPAEEWLGCIWRHLDVGQVLKERGRCLKPLPFAGAIYRVNSENISNVSLANERYSSLKGRAWKLFFRRPMTKKLKTEFSIPF